MVLATLTWLDVLLVLMFVASIGFGFKQGFLRQFFLLVSMYIATVLAAMYHGLLGSVLMGMFPGTVLSMANMIAFLLLVVAFSIFVTWLLWTGYRETRLPSVVMLDELGGTALGVVIGIFAVNLAIVSARYAVSAPWPDDSPVRTLLLQGVNYSALQHSFVSILPLIQGVVRPWLPDGLPTLLAG